MELVRKYLSADEITPAGTRYDFDCDCVQTSSDGGATWTDAPGADPRHADSFRVPALSTADPKCDAAANMIALLRTMIDADIAALNVVAAATAFIGLVSLFFPIVLLADLVIAVAGIIAGIGGVALSDAFTEDVYHRLLCTFEAHLESDGTLTATDLGDLLTDIGANYDSVVFDAISAHTSTLGEVGWSNAGASGSETGDCSDCGPQCYGIDFTIDADFGSVHDYQGLWIDGRGWTWVTVGSDDSQVNISTLWNTGTPCRYIHAEVDVRTYGAGVIYYVYGRTNNDIPDHDQNLLMTGTCSTGYSTLAVDLDGLTDYYGLQIVLDTPGSTSTGMDVRGARIISPNLGAAGLVSNC